MYEKRKPCFVCAFQGHYKRDAILDLMSRATLWGRRFAQGKTLCPNHETELCARIMKGVHDEKTA